MLKFIEMYVYKATTKFDLIMNGDFTINRKLPCQELQDTVRWAYPNLLESIFRSRRKDSLELHSSMPLSTPHNYPEFSA